MRQRERKSRRIGMEGQAKRQSTYLELSAKGGHSIHLGHDGGLGGGREERREKGRRGGVPLESSHALARAPGFAAETRLEGA